VHNYTEEEIEDILQKNFAAYQTAGERHRLESEITRLDDSRQRILSGGSSHCGREVPFAENDPVQIRDGQSLRLAFTCVRVRCVLTPQFGIGRGTRYNRLRWLCASFLFGSAFAAFA
jgi:hypothetical protein